MPVATASSGRALYDHASTAFVHNMPLEALNTVHAAVQTGQAGTTQQLAEQFLVLQITALCAIYSPNDPAQLEARLQHWRQGPGREAQLPTELTEQLILPPERFFARMWTQSLRFYQSIPTVPSITSAVPDANATSITPTPEVLRSALQLPAAVIEALVLGALKVDEDLARHSSSSKSNGKASTKGKDVPAGLQAARAMCEWVLSAYSSAGLDTIADRKHLHDQYGRVLRLYALELLGLRLQDWEYAREMVRCAKLITGDQREIDERTALLAEMAEAHNEAEARHDRRQAAKDKARRILQEQVEKRKLSASLGDLPSPKSAPISPSPVIPPTSHENKQREGKTRSSSHSPLQSPSSEKSAEMANGTQKGQGKGSSQARSRSASAAMERSPTSSSSSPSASRRSTINRSSSGSGDLMPASMFASLRTILQAWLRRLGGAPAILLAVFAALMLARRVMRAAQGRVSVLGSAARPTTSRTALVSRQQRPAPESGFFSSAWRKMLDTVRM